MSEAWEMRIANALERIADCMEARVGMEVDLSDEYVPPTFFAAASRAMPLPASPIDMRSTQVFEGALQAEPQSTLVPNTGAPLPPPRLPAWMQPVENGKTPDA